MAWHSWTTSLIYLSSSRVQSQLKRAAKMLDVLQPSCYRVYQTPVCNDSMMWLATYLCYMLNKSKLLLINQILSGSYNLCKFLHLLFLGNVWIDSLWRNHPRMQPTRQSCCNPLTPLVFGENKLCFFEELQNLLCNKLVLKIWLLYNTSPIFLIISVNI